MTSVSKNVYINKLDDIVNEYNYKNTYHRTIKMKPINIEKEIDDKEPRFKVGGHIRILK